MKEREAREVLRELERKAELVGLEDWKKFYGLVARSIEKKARLRKEGFLAWDLGILRGSRNQLVIPPRVEKHFRELRVLREGA